MRDQPSQQFFDCVYGVWLLHRVDVDFEQPLSLENLEEALVLLDLMAVEAEAELVVRETVEEISAEEALALEQGGHILEA